MKIVYLSSSVVPSRSANSIHVMKMCQALAKNGHKVVLLAPDDKENYEPNIEDLYSYYGVDRCFKIFKLAWFPIRGRSAFYSLIASLKARRLDPNIVYCRNNFALIFLVILRLPVIFEIHTPFVNEGRWLDWIVKICFNSRSVLKIVFITHGLRRYFEQRYPSISSKIIVAPDGADPLSPAIVPMTMEHCGERFQVGYVGHLYAGKGMEIIGALARQCLWADFNIVGGTAEDLVTWRSKYRNLSNIIFHGYVSNEFVPAYILAFDVVLLPNLKNVSVHGGGGNIGDWTSPLKAFEYMAAAKPIISSDLPVLREIFEHDKNALLCPPDNLQTWVSALQTLRGDEVTRLRLGQEARNDFLRKYTWAMRASTILKSIDLQFTDQI